MAAQGGSGRLTATAANDIAAGSIVVDLNTGNGTPLNNQTSTDRSQQFGLAVQVPAEPAPTVPRPRIRSSFATSNQTFYLRADLPTLLSDLGQSPSSAAGFQRAAQGADQLRPGIGGARPGKLGIGSRLGADGPAAGPASAGARRGRYVEPVDRRADVVTAPRCVHRQRQLTPRSARPGVAPTTRRRWRSSRSSRTSSSRCRRPSGAFRERRRLASRSTGPSARSRPTRSSSPMSGSETTRCRRSTSISTSSNTSSPSPCRCGSRSDPARRSSLPSGATPLNLSNLGNLLGGMLGKSSST